MTTARELLEAAWAESLGDANGSVPDAIAATPSGAELLRRADEPRVAEGPCQFTMDDWTCLRPASDPNHEDRFEHGTLASHRYLPAPRPPAPDRTAALERIRAWACGQPEGWVDFIRNECDQALAATPEATPVADGTVEG